MRLQLQSLFLSLRSNLLFLNKNKEMKRKIHFIKMHGLGNDYIFVDTARFPINNPSKLAIEWSRRHTGIGSDGLVLIDRCTTPDADFTMRFYNADGSEGEMCGNASRCIGKYVYESGLTTSTSVRLKTLAGIKILDLKLDKECKVEEITVDMLEPILNDPSQYSPKGEGLPQGTFVSMGCPHYVIFVDDISAIDLATLGAKLEYHPSFPERCNIEFAQVVDRGIRMRVWERGSGITMACGTGACATAVAAALTGRAQRHSTIIMDGGPLKVEWRESDNHVYLIGPATTVFEGDIELVD